MLAKLFGCLLYLARKAGGRCVSRYLYSTVNAAGGGVMSLLRRNCCIQRTSISGAIATSTAGWSRLPSALKLSSGRTV